MRTGRPAEARSASTVSTARRSAGAIVASSSWRSGAPPSQPAAAIAAASLLDEPLRAPRSARRGSRRRCARPRGRSRSSTGSDLGADPVAGEARGSRCVGSSANGSPASRASVADLLAAATEQRADDPAAGRTQPEQRPRPGRDREPVEHRLGDVGAGVPGRDPVGAELRAQPLGRLVAGLAGARLEVAAPRARGRSMWRSMRSFAHSARAASSPASPASRAARS